MDQPAPDLDDDACYRAVLSRDRRFDGYFFTAVKTTGIYCRPSCPARTPARGNVAFHRTSASAHAAGFRACKRCLPDATPGSPRWDLAADLAGRAMRLIGDGVVDRGGVEALAERLGFSSRHLNRVLTRELGAGPLALARAQRAQTARALIENTDLALADAAFAAGFSSVRQFNATMVEVYGVSPSALRAGPSATLLAADDVHRGVRGVGDLTGRGGASGVSGVVQMRIGVRTPFPGRAILGFLAARTVPGVEFVDGTSYARTLRLPHGPGVVRLELSDLPADKSGLVAATFELSDLRDLTTAMERTRRLLDADCDPIAVDGALGEDPLIGDLVRAVPGLRVPGQVDGVELAVRGVIGQQISVSGARTVTARIVEQYGDPISCSVPELTHLFPSPSTLADADPDRLGMPKSRGRALTALCAAAATGDLVLDRGEDRREVRAALLALPGIGPWTADYIALRALADPDILLTTDIGVRNALAKLGADPTAAAELGERWRPWRSYAQLHLWHSLAAPGGSGVKAARTQADPNEEG